jgi:eukaryotic-like serine/threonine-protein kinase
MEGTDFKREECSAFNPYQSWEYDLKKSLYGLPVALEILDRNAWIYARIYSLGVLYYSKVPIHFTCLRTNQNRNQVTMKKQKLNIVLILNILLVILLAACNSPSAAAPTPPDVEAAPTNEIIPPTQQPEPTDIPAATEIPTASAPLPTAEPTELAGGTVRTSDIDGMEQVYVDSGDFLMGAVPNDPFAKTSIENGRAYPEIPQFTLYLDGYWFDKYEVTNAQWAKCVDAGACKPSNLERSFTREKYYGNPDFDNYPVLYVDWFMAGEYCEWAGRRLPTEAEWEKAARGTDGRLYPWGNEEITGEYANFCDINCPEIKLHANPNYDDGYPDTAPVGSFPKGASPYGAMDMSGNVWEWTSTIVMPYPYDAADGREDPDPTDVPGERVWRGGTWSNGTWWLRSSIRYRSVQTYWYGNLGFRCATSE